MFSMFSFSTLFTVIIALGSLYFGAKPYFQAVDLATTALFETPNVSWPTWTALLLFVACISTCLGLVLWTHTVWFLLACLACACLVEIVKTA